MNDPILAVALATARHDDLMREVRLAGQRPQPERGARQRPRPAHWARTRLRAVSAVRRRAVTTNPEPTS